MPDLLAAGLREGFGYTVRRGLRGVWLRGDLPAGPFVWAARDEQVNLARTLPGLLAQPAEQIVVYDDGSRDDTAAVVTGHADPRLRLITGPPPPPGWTGKNWAGHQLAAATDAELLVFCDADVTLRPAALDALVPVTAPAALPVYALALRRTAWWKGRAYR